MTEPSALHPARALAACAAIAAACSSAFAADVVRHPLPNSDFPIAMAVEVPAGRKLVFLSGGGPSIADRSARPDSFAAYGDMRVQTLSTLETLDANLKRLKMSLKDVVKMQVFLVGDPLKEGHIDFAGFMDGYRQYFGAQNLPARTTVKVAGLVNPGWLVEIEVTAVAPE